MTEAELYGEFRELIGNPSPTDVSNRQLKAHLIPALEWMAQELRWNVVTDDTGLLLVANRQEYTLPPEIMFILWVHWNNLPLTPKSVWAWDREGTLWQSATALDVLTEFAIHGRQLILFAPPTALAVTTDPYLHLRYIGTPVLDAMGVTGLSEMDQYIAVLRAAIRYCRSHPSDENNLRAENYAQELAEHLPVAKRRNMLMVDTHLPSLLPYSERTGGARLRVSIRRPIHTDIGRFSRYNTVKEDLDCGPI